MRAVCRDGEHRFSKPVVEDIELVAGLGVAGDAHSGATVRHRSRLRADAHAPNLRQVHLIHAELHEELIARGFGVAPGDMGENVTTDGVDLLALPRGTLLHLGSTGVVEVTGLRNPCRQLDDFQPGLMRAVLDRGPDSELLRKAGVMAVVRVGGRVWAGDPVRVELPAEPHVPLVAV